MYKRLLLRISACMKNMLGWCLMLRKQTPAFAGGRDPLTSPPSLPMRYLFKSSVKKVSFAEHVTGLGLFLGSNFIWS